MLSSTPYACCPMIPGPTSLYPAVRDALALDYGSGDLEDDFFALYAKTCSQLATLMGSSHKVALLTGEGMLALWGALKSCLRAGDKVLCVGTGVFGDGFAPMAESIGCRVQLISLPYNSTIGAGDSLSIIEKCAKDFKPDMLTAVHCETPSGTLNPLYELGSIKKSLGIPLFCLDAVASLGGAEIESEAWNVDLLLGGSQKCLSAPPSMSIAGASDAAIARMREVAYHGYDSLLPALFAVENGVFPHTPYWHGVACLEAALATIFAEGLENVFRRHAQCAEICRAGLQGLGIKLFPAHNSIPSPTVTAAELPGHLNFAEWRNRLKKEGLYLAGSYGPMSGKVFRLGHMGAQADPVLVHKALDIIGANI